MLQAQFTNRGVYTAIRLGKAWVGDQNFRQNRFLFGKLFTQSVDKYSQDLPPSTFPVFILLTQGSLSFYLPKTPTMDLIQRPFMHWSC